MSVSMATAERAWCLVVPHHARGARIARQRLANELAGNVADSLLADVVTVVAELVGNAIRHADPLPGGVVRVAWRLRPDHLDQMIEVRVTDGGAAVGAPRIRTVDLEASDGRGLAIVAALADQWGVDRDGLGQSVWARLSARPLPTHSAPRLTPAAPVVPSPAGPASPGLNGSAGPNGA